ncbi:hypothetical protein Hdeb2414_s0204g00831991 [Helianthus debilis subsp. tardiflorus]
MSNPQPETVTTTTTTTTTTIPTVNETTSRFVIELSNSTLCSTMKLSFNYDVVCKSTELH